MNYRIMIWKKKRKNKIYSKRKYTYFKWKKKKKKTRKKISAAGNRNPYDCELNWLFLMICSKQSNVSFLLSFFVCDTLTSNVNSFGGHAIIHIFNQPIRDEPIKSWGIKTENTPRVVIRLVNIFNCLAMTGWS